MQLGLQIDQRLDDLVRELQLIDFNGGSTPPRELGQLIERLATRPALRHLGRRIALDAAAAGMEYVNIEMARIDAWCTRADCDMSGVRAAYIAASIRPCDGQLSTPAH